MFHNRDGRNLERTLKKSFWQSTGGRKTENRDQGGEKDDKKRKNRGTRVMGLRYISVMGEWYSCISRADSTILRV